MGFAHYPKLDDTVIISSTKPLKIGESFEGSHVASPYTRFYGTVYSDQPGTLYLEFSCEETPLCWDVCEEKRIEAGKGRGIFTLIYGRHLRVRFAHANDQDQKEFRLYICGSCF